MTRRDLESAVAAATGEDVREIRRRGFSVLNLRQRLVTQLASVQSSLDGLMVDRPRRNILRKPR